MRRLTHLTSLALLVALMSSCAEQPSPTGIGFAPDGPPISLATGGKIRGGGFDGAANEGLLGPWFWPPFDWRRLPPDIGGATGGPDFQQQCVVQGHCAVGHAGFTSFAGLGVPSNRDPNPDPGPEQFAVLSTTNFFMDLDFDGKDELIRTTESAIRHRFDLPVGGWRLQVDLAFLTGEMGRGAQNDFASITIRSVPASGTPVEIRFEADDPLAWKPGGCDSVTFLGSRVKSGYPRCTDWKPYSVDVSRFGGQDVFVELRVGEGGPDNRVATSLAVDNLKFVQFNLRPVVGPISVSASEHTAGWSVQARADFTDGDPTDTHRAVWNWGDGTITKPATLKQGAGFGSVSNSHTYRRPGIYTITLTVTDKPDGGVGRRRRQITFDDLVTNSPARESGIELANSRACLTGTKHGTRLKGCDAVALAN
jgi:hypothetical protein